MYIIILLLIIWILIISRRLKNLEEKMVNENEDALRKFNDDMQNQTGDNQTILNDTPVPGQQIYSNVDPKIANQMQVAEQQIANQINMGPPPSSDAPTTFGKCPDCGLMHPPLPTGQKCPSAPVENKTTGQAVDLADFFNQLRNIVSSQIAQKGIQNVPKLLSHIIVILTQSLETYKE